VDRDELDEKLGRLRHVMEAQGLDAVQLDHLPNVAWLTGGARLYVNTAAETGAGSLLVTPDRQYLLTDVIEGRRLREEEGFAGGPWDVIEEPWQEPRTRLTGLTRGLRVGADRPGPGQEDVAAEVARLRRTLTPPEIARFRALGADAGRAIGEAARAVRPGMTEFEIAGLLAQATYARGALPIVALVAVDARMETRRHPLPTAMRLERAALLVLCARRHGLVASASRIVHVGPAPAELRSRVRAAATIDAITIANTRPGAALNRIFARLQQAYADMGWPDEWRNHHQGGLAGYEPREIVATPYTPETVELGQVYAWNPSVPGAKSEDSVLITAAGADILTTTPDWPALDITVEGTQLARPDLLELA
jgi:Xaa-Pro aminopeptidase